MTAAEEFVVLLDDAGHPIGTELKSSVHTRTTPLHLAFSCYVFDPAGRFLITRRAFGKRTWPGVWTNSCCGHPAPGEAVEKAVERRTAQELGVTVTGLRLVLPGFRYRATMADGTMENELCPVFVAGCADPESVVADPSEVAEAAWVDWPSFRAEALAGRRAVSPWCLKQLAAMPADPR